MTLTYVFVSEMITQHFKYILHIYWLSQSASENKKKKKLPEFQEFTKQNKTKQNKNLYSNEHLQENKREHNLLNPIFTDVTKYRETVTRLPV